MLADALTYAARLKPDVIIDAATLTGAALVALGKTCSAFYSSDDELARGLERAARTAGEQFWRMPLLEELGELLKRRGRPEAHRRSLGRLDQRGAVFARVRR